MNSQAVSRQATKPFFTQRGSPIILCFALRLLVVFIENIRNPIEARNGGLPHSSLPKRRIFDYKGTYFLVKSTLLNKKTDFIHATFSLCLAKTGRNSP